MTKQELRNRANAHDRPRTASTLREVPLVKSDSPVQNRCRECQGHEHVFMYGDRYGCCTRCGDEVLT